MDRPTECKYCGREGVAVKTNFEIVFRCWSSYVVEDDYWTVSGDCAVRCAVQLVELRGRVQRAVEVLEGAARYRVEKDKYGTYMQSGINGGWLDVIEVEQVIEILKGETDGKAD